MPHPKEMTTTDLRALRDDLRLNIEDNETAGEKAKVAQLWNELRPIYNELDARGKLQHHRGAQGISMIIASGLLVLLTFVLRALSPMTPILQKGILFIGLSTAIPSCVFGITQLIRAKRIDL